MEGYVSKQSLLNLPVSGNVDTTSLPGFTAIPGLLPIPTGSVISVTATAAAAEVVQVVNIGAVTVPTIVASTKYQIGIGNTGNRVEGAQAQIKKYGTTSDAILTGTAAFDRHNVYVSLAYKVTHDTSAQCVAYAIQTLPQTTNAAAYAAGEIITGTTSGATGVVLSGTTGTLTVGSLNGTKFTTGEAATGSITGATTTMGTVVTGVSLRVIDNAGYYDVETKRSGANTVMATAGLTSGMVVVSTAAVYSEGQGTKLLTFVYAQERTSSNRASGQYGFATNQAPVAGRAYTRYDIVSRPNASISALSETITKTEVRQRVYADNAAAGYGAFNTAILAIT